MLRSFDGSAMPARPSVGLSVESGIWGPIVGCRYGDLGRLAARERERGRERGREERREEGGREAISRSDIPLDRRSRRRRRERKRRREE